MRLVHSFKFLLWITLYSLLLVGASRTVVYSQIPNLPGGFTLDTANKEMIHLVSSDMGTFILEDNVTLNILSGNVVFDHKGDRLYADSARLNITKNIVHAYGNVQVLQTDGTTAFADKMFYNGHSKNVELTGNVELHSDGDFLWSNRLDYNLNTQIGKYYNSGTLQTGATIIESKSAVYNGKTHNARFKGDVHVNDPEYTVDSDDLNYNTETRVVTFYGPSIIENDSSTLYTTKGTYDSENEIAIFVNRSSIQSDAQYMEADSMYYNRVSGWGFGTGNVVLIDTNRNTTLYCNFSAINEKSKQALSTGNPYAIMAQDKDTTYITADTFFSEPTRNMSSIRTPQNAQDSLLMELDMLFRKAETGELLDSNLVHSLDSLNILMQENDTLDLDVDDLIDFRMPFEENDSLLNEIVIDSIPIVDSIKLPDIVSEESRPNLLEPTEQNISDSVQTSDTVVAAIGKVPIPLNDSIKTKENIEGAPSAYSSPQTLQSKKDEDPRYFIAYRNVVVYNDSFQARADSMVYIQDDSLMKFFYKPILWTRNAQVTGDEITAFVDSQEVRWVHIPKNGIIINQSTTANEIMFDQIQGNVIWAYLSNNEMDSVLAYGNAQTIYYIQDDEDAYIGVSEVSSMDLKIIFYVDSNQKRAIKELIYYGENTQKTTPMLDAHPDLLRLDRFVWRKEEKMENLESFLEFVYLEEKSKGPLLKETVKEKLQISSD